MDSPEIYKACVRRLKCAKLEKESNELARKYDESKDITYLQKSNELKKKLKQLRGNGGTI